MSRDGHDYLAQSLGQNGHSLGMDYVIWSLGTWAMLGQLECRLGIGCVTFRALTGHVRRHTMDKIICHVGWTQGLLFDGH